jgi:2-polyprenyl-3-methyl-5-hydroxy-6-metoxy-1,4-benzoquinol methylase
VGPSPLNTDAKSKHFWDSCWDTFEPFELDCASFRENSGASEKSFLLRIGDIRGKQVLEIGGGTGALAVYLAKMGAEVTVIDSSETAVQKILGMIKKNQGETQVQVHCLNASELTQLGNTFDLILGEFI